MLHGRESQYVVLGVRFGSPVCTSLYHCQRLICPTVQMRHASCNLMQSRTLGTTDYTTVYHSVSATLIHSGICAVVARLSIPVFESRMVVLCTKYRNTVTTQVCDW